MENENHDSDAAAQQGPERPETASKKTGLIQAIRHSLAESKPTIKALDALAEFQCPTPPPPETVCEAEIACDVCKVDAQDCGGPTR